MKEDEFKAELNTLLKMVTQLNPWRVLVNTVDFKFEVSDSDQNWLVTFFIEKVINNGVQRYAIVVPPDDLRSKEVETDAIEDENFTLQYFNHEPTANAWLLDVS